MKIPGPDHPITIAPHPGRVRVRVADVVVADSQAALVLTEASYPPVVYVPRPDVAVGLIRRTGTRTNCPYKGDATYWTVATGGGAERPDAAWSYETPHPAVAAIAGYLAFYPDRVDAIETVG